MSELVEKVARAICADNIKYNGAWESRSLDERIEDEWPAWSSEATAAIAAVLDALQEPSEWMVEAADGIDVMGADLHDFTVYSCAGPVWQAMLAKFREEQGL